MFSFSNWLTLIMIVYVSSIQQSGFLSSLACILNLGQCHLHLMISKVSLIATFLCLDKIRVRKHVSVNLNILNVIVK